MGGLALIPQAIMGALGAGGSAAAGTGAAAAGGAAAGGAAAGGIGSALGTAATVASAGAGLAGALAKPKLPGQPKAIPMPDPEADAAARRRVVAAEMARAGRASTNLGGSSTRRTLG